MEEEKSQEQIRYENTLLQSMTGEYRTCPLNSIGNIIHWIRVYGFHQYDSISIGDGHVNFGGLMATFVIDKNLDMPVFTFDAKYDWLQNAQDNFIKCKKENKYPNPYEKYL